MTEPDKSLEQDAQIQRRALLTEIRSAFDSDSVVAKNLALRRAHIALSGQSTPNDDAGFMLTSPDSATNDQREPTNPAA